MAKKDILILLSVHNLEELKKKITADPEGALHEVKRLIHLAHNKIDNDYTADQIKQVVSKYYGVPCDLFTTTKDGSKFSQVKPRRMFATLLAHFTDLERKEIQALCGYAHNSTVALALTDTAHLVNQTQAGENDYLALQEALRNLKNP